MIRIATYNVEWFASLFDEEDQLVFDHSWSGRSDVTKSQQLDALGHVFQTIDADAIMVIEAPNTGRTQRTERALENFAAQYDLRQRAALTGFTNGTQQEIALFYDPDVLSARHSPLGDETTDKGLAQNARFDGAYRYDLNTDAQADLIRFSKPPLEATITLKSGRELSLIGVHAKSKAPHGAKNKADEIRIAIENRRKQLAQCIWIRERAEQVLDLGHDLIVLGDFNDGPGLDIYEKLFGQSGVEIVMGLAEDDAHRLFDPHANLALSPRNFVLPTTARFYKYDSKTYLNALLDYVMVSEALKDKGSWTIWHPFDHPECFNDEVMRKALLTGSDHFPVSVDLDI
ncbi:MAG: endonuclease/exonuclease/phosphatase family protein [Pseudomonadota bacterium]